MASLYKDHHGERLYSPLSTAVLACARDFLLLQIAKFGSSIGNARIEVTHETVSGVFHAQAPR